jgi:hypothetical protein
VFFSPWRAAFRPTLTSKGAFSNRKRLFADRPFFAVLAPTSHYYACVPVLQSACMSLDVYVDGKQASHFIMAFEWDAAATWIEKNTPHRTPLRRLAEEGETHQPQEAAAMLADILKVHKPSPDVQHTLRVLHRLLKWGKHVVIADGVTSAP